MPKLIEGYIYLLRLHQSDNIYECPYKIGRTINVDQRFQQLANMLPYKTTIVHTAWSSDTVADEELLHQKFAHKRLNGEWFKLDEDDLVYLLRLDATYVFCGDEDLPF